MIDVQRELGYLDNIFHDQRQARTAVNQLLGTVENFISEAARWSKSKVKSKRSTRQNDEVIIGSQESFTRIQADKDTDKRNYSWVISMTKMVWFAYITLHNIPKAFLIDFESYKYGCNF